MGESEQLCVHACVSTLAFRHQLMNLVNMNITQDLNDTSFSLWSHAYSLKKVISTESSPSRIHPSCADNIIQNESAVWKFTNQAAITPILPKFAIFVLYTNTIEHRLPKVFTHPSESVNSGVPVTFTAMCKTKHLL